MLDAICAHIHNYFETGRRPGTYTVAEGRLELPFVKAGQYFRVTGSDLNDGVYRYPAEDLRDETFTGEIWPMAVPRAVLALSGEIDAWTEKYGEASQSPYQSENVIGVYSYTRATGSVAGAGWQGAFRERLNPWRRLS